MHFHGPQILAASILLVPSLVSAGDPATYCWPWMTCNHDKRDVYGPGNTHWRREGAYVDDAWRQDRARVGE
jgi:hypothetical protein